MIGGHADSTRVNQLATALAETDDPARALRAAGHVAAAADVQSGRPLAEVLRARALLPPIYRAPFGVNAPQATRALINAAARSEDRFARVRRVARAALASAASAWIVMLGATLWAVPAYLAYFAECGSALPAIVVLGVEVFATLASPAGMICAAVAVLAGWLGVRALWIRSPAGRRSEDAFCATALATLVDAGVAVPDALRQVASATRRSGRFLAAAEALERGEPVSKALRQTGLIAPDQGGLVDRSGAALPGVLRAIAAIREADEGARAPHAGQWIWAVYAVVIGLAAAVFAGLIMGGSVAVMQCVG